MGTEVTTKEKPKSGKKGPPKKSTQNGVDTGANDVNRVGRGTGGYQQPTNDNEKLVDDWFEKHANKQWKKLLERMSSEQAGTLHSLLSIGSQESTQVHSRTAVSPDTTHGVTQGTSGVSTSRQPEKVMQEKNFFTVKTVQKVTP